MTTFKNNAKYAELLMSYMELAVRDDNPLTPQAVLETMVWMFKGGSLGEASQKTRLKPETSDDRFPEGLSEDLAKSWGTSVDSLALRRVVMRRLRMRKRRSVDAVMGTWLMLTSRYSLDPSVGPVKIYSGMRAIYWIFGRLWSEAQSVRGTHYWDLLRVYTKEMAAGTGQVARMNLATLFERSGEYWGLIEATRVEGLLQIVEQIKLMMRHIGSKQTKAQARLVGKLDRERWDHLVHTDEVKGFPADLSSEHVACVRLQLGMRVVRVSQEVVLLNTGRVRYALSKSDLERLHQLVMSTASCIVGVCAQAAVGTKKQKGLAKSAIETVERNIQRVVDSSGKVPLGDEVLVCKGYRRAYTAHLGFLAGPLCAEETAVLMKEAEDTAGPGVLDIMGYCSDLRCLDAANALNAGKVFKICPAPDVSPGGAMIDRVLQIGDCNTFDPEMSEMFRAELTGQILRAFIRTKGVKLTLRPSVSKPAWWLGYSKKDFAQVPSMEIDTYLAWEGKGKMPNVSAYDPRNWKDSGLGADTKREAESHNELGHKKNMLTRLLFDEECPMPGRMVLSEEHVIKFFVKAEGHKDPARGIFSANLTDRQAQSWMERGVEAVAKNHPSFMIGAESDAREMKVRQLTARPKDPTWVALYYSFDISGWSAKMPAEPQRISHEVWSKLYGGHLYKRAREINEGALVYVNLDGYYGWYRNTASNLEGFNGKEMTMVLVALLSLSVRVWRKQVVEENLLTEEEAGGTSALLFAYIDDGLSRIDLPRSKALPAFNCYKRCVIDTFSRCGFTVETSKCFPSDRFSIFLNEVYLAGRHVVHGVRAAMGISSEPTERHTTLVERLTSVSTGCRGAVMAGLSPLSAVFLMAYHCLMHLVEWVDETDPTVLAIWCLSPRTWGGLGLPNMLQLAVSGSGAAFEEGVATMQKYGHVNETAKCYFINMCKSELSDRKPTSVLTAPLSSRVSEGYMVDSRVASLVRNALVKKLDQGVLSPYATRLLQYGDTAGFLEYAESVVHLGELEVVQEQMLSNVFESHPHSIFSSFAKRVEKSATVSEILGQKVFWELMRTNRIEAKESVDMVHMHLRRPAYDR